MMDIAGLVLFRNCVGISTSSPDAEVKRIANESPYTIVVATSLLRGAIAKSVTKVFEVIVYLRLLRAMGGPDHLPDRNCNCARAIAALAERLLLTAYVVANRLGFRRLAS